jgi:hypothetical protein
MAAKEHPGKIIFILVVAALLGAAIGYGAVRGFQFSASESDGSGDISGERYATLADAQIICEAKAREVFGQRLRNLNTDSHSTRLDKKARLFRVFLVGDVYPGEAGQGAPNRYYFACVARTDRVAIASFQYAKDGEAMKD